MNIIEQKFTNAINIAICIFPAVNINDRPESAEIMEKMTEFTKFYAMRLNQLVDSDGIKIHNFTVDSIDRGLTMYGQRFNHILFMAAGAKIHDMSILFDIRDEIGRNPNYLAAAHILDWQEDWYQLHEQFVLVNCRNWLLAGRPQFGSWNPGTAELPVINRSEENFHHDYTPLWIEFTGEFKQQRHSKPGWNFLNAAARNNMTIINWNKTIRDKRTYYYPETNGPELLQSIKTMTNCGITNPNQLQLLRSLTTTASQIWLLNSEDMSLPAGQYDTIALTASGFKFLEVFKENLLTPTGQLIIYDFNPQSIEWIKHLHSETSLDIPAMVQAWPNKANFKILGGQIEHQGGVHLTEYFYASLQRTIDFYGGLTQFNELVKRFRATEIKFVEVNLFDEPGTLTNQFTGATLLNISNIYSTDFSNAYYGFAKTEQAYNALLQSITVPATIVGHNAKCKLTNINVNQ